MILIDANILIYAYVPTLLHHEAARRWLVLGELLRKVVDRPTLIPDQV